MENGSTFIGIALTIVCLLPIILMYIKKKKSGTKKKSRYASGIIVEDVKSKFRAKLLKTSNPGS